MKSNYTKQEMSNWKEEEVNSPLAKKVEKVRCFRVNRYGLYGMYTKALLSVQVYCSGDRNNQFAGAKTESGAKCKA